jgi:hypothetical protein
MKEYIGLAGRARVARWLLVVSMLVGASCTTKDVVIPPITGPSTYGMSVRITLTPDIMYADGQSQSQVRLVVSGPDGKGVANQTVYLFTGNDALEVVNIGRLSANVVVSGPDGSATASYTAPLERDFAANQRVSIIGRLAGQNAQGVATINGQYAKILLAAVDNRTWPPGTSHPTCAMMSDPRYSPWYAGVPIRFTTRSTPAAGTYIIQYLWRFGDDETKYYYTPDVVHTFTAPGDYQIFQSVLDNNGAVDSCLFSQNGNPWMTIVNP